MSTGASTGAGKANIRKRAIVRGRVQGVSYRAHTRAQAERRGLVGWVQNLPDGSVELEAQGPAPAVEALLAWCHDGPDLAAVSGVTVEARPLAAGETEFAVRR